MITFQGPINESWFYQFVTIVKLFRNDLQRSENNLRWLDLSDFTSMSCYEEFETLPNDYSAIVKQWELFEPSHKAPNLLISKIFVKELATMFYMWFLTLYKSVYPFMNSFSHLCSFLDSYVSIFQEGVVLRCHFERWQ